MRRSNPMMAAIMIINMCHERPNTFLFGEEVCETAGVVLLILVTLGELEGGSY